MPQLSISPKFFRNERRNYSDFLFSFWRELYQNSIDAGAKNIAITIPDPSQVKTNPLITFSDDGVGFSAKIRDEVYFCLGETSKGGGYVGGFGKARIVTCFSHEYYIIESCDWKVKGTGSDYTVYENDFQHGTTVAVKMDTGQHSTHQVKQALYRFLCLCHNPNCNVVINGVQFNDWCHKRRFARELSFGNVYTNKSGDHLNTLIVRVSGVAMFTRYINPDIQVVIEINSFNSREILLSNRDGLRVEYADELNSFIQSLASNMKEILRRDRRIMAIYGNKPKVTKRKEKKVTGSFKECVITGTQKNGVTPNGVTPNGFSKVVSEAALRISDQRLMDDINEMIPSAVLICDSYNQKIRNVAQRYNPDRWAYFEKNKGGNREKLLRQWTILCDFAIQYLLEIVDSESIYWRPGFYLSDDYVAYHVMSVEDGCDVHALMVNPVDNDGKMQYKLRDKNDWTSLMVSAAHEVSHIVCNGHNEDFVGMFGKLTKKMFQNRKVIFSSLLNSLKIFRDSHISC